VNKVKGWLDSLSKKSGKEVLYFSTTKFVVLQGRCYIFLEQKLCSKKSWNSTWPGRAWLLFLLGGYAYDRTLNNHLTQNLWQQILVVCNTSAALCYQQTGACFVEDCTVLLK